MVWIAAAGSAAVGPDQTAGAGRRRADRPDGTALRPDGEVTDERVPVRPSRKDARLDAVGADVQKPAASALGVVDDPGPASAVGLRLGARLEARFATDLDVEAAQISRQQQSLTAEG